MLPGHQGKLILYPSSLDVNCHHINRAADFFNRSMTSSKISCSCCQYQL